MTTVVAGLVIETVPERALEVAGRIDGWQGLSIKGNDGDRRLAAVWTGEDGQQLEKLAEELVANEEQVLGVFPTFVGQDDGT